MTSDMYEPPKSDLSSAEKKPGSAVKAVVVGTLVEIVGTFLVGILIGIVYGFNLARQGVSPDDVQRSFEQLGYWSGYRLAAMVFGALVSVLAGYICARTANTVSYKSAYILSGISFAFGVILGYGSVSWGELTVLGMISVGCVLVGAWSYNRTL